MKLLRYTTILMGLTAAVISVSYFTSLFAQQQPPPDPQPAAVAEGGFEPIPDDQMEIQTSGPVHEGFASPLTTETPETIIVEKQPPEPIEELPPEQKPEGSNVVWIPGYFAWDDQRDDFIWISGFWRDVPPERVWVSGYWTQATKGWQWVPGFWTASEQTEVTYLPQPPEPVETGPSIEQPSANHFWVPGHWTWLGNHYVWRTGYWARIQPDWVWVPAHYVWCPSGYVFVDGFWDYPVVRRGLLFAPVYFDRVVYRRPHYFTPTIVWSTQLLTTHLFVRPVYYHYYFGNYYDDRYVNLGIRPWYLSFTFGRVSYDPLFTYYRWQNRDRDWTREVRDRYDYYRRNRDSRPPRTYREQQQFVARAENRNALRNTVVAAPLTQVVNRTTVNNLTANVINSNFSTPFRFDRVAHEDRRQLARQADDLRNVVRQRRQVETRENIARVEGQAAKGARKGEDERMRHPAPRRLDISGAAQAIGVTAERGRGGIVRDRGDTGAARIDSGVIPPRAIVEQNGREITPRTLRPDRGPDRDRSEPGRGRDVGRVGVERGPDLGKVQGEAGRGTGRPQTDVRTPGRGPDLGLPGRTPDIERPPALDNKPGERSPDFRGRGRGRSPSEDRPLDARPDLTRPRTNVPPDTGRPSSRRDVTREAAPPPTVERARPSPGRPLAPGAAAVRRGAERPPEVRVERKPEPPRPSRVDVPRAVPTPRAQTSPPPESRPRPQPPPSVSRPVDRPPAANESRGRGKPPDSGDKDKDRKKGGQ